MASRLITTATVLGVFIAFGAAGGASHAQTGSSSFLLVCHGNSDCTSDSDSGSGVIKPSVSAFGACNGCFAETVLEVYPAQFSQSGDPEIFYQSTANALSANTSFVSTFSETYFDQDQSVAHLNTSLVADTTGYVDYTMQFDLDVTGTCIDGSYARVDTNWYFRPNGGSLSDLDEGSTRLFANSSLISSGHHDDLSIVNMGGGQWVATGSGQIPVSDIPVNTTPLIGVRVQQEAHVELGSMSCTANAASASGSPGIQFVLVPDDPNVTISAFPSPVPEPTSTGIAAIVTLAFLARFRRFTRA